MTLKPRLCIVLTGLALALTGCAGYRLGPTNGMAAGSRTIQVNAFLNDTMEPRLSEAVVEALRKRFQQDGTYRLASQSDGDIVVRGTITKYYREPVTFQPQDVISVSDFEVTLTCHVIAENRATGEKLVDQLVRGRATIRVGNDQANAERMALPQLAEDLARNAAALVVDGSW